jgi:hypothetical protein
MKAYYPPKISKAARKAYEEWAAKHQKSKPYEAIEGSSHVGGKTKKRVNTIFNKLPGINDD